MAFWSQSDLIDEIGTDAALAGLDDDNDGAIDEGALVRLQSKSDAHVIGRIRGSRHVGDMAGIVAAPPEQLVRLSLEYAKAQVWKRAPAHARSDWSELESSVNAELTDIRRGIVRLDVAGVPADPANVGGKLIDHAGSLTEPPVKFFTGCGGMGDF